MAQKQPPLYERIKAGLIELEPDELMEQIASMVEKAFHAGMHTKEDDADWWKQFNGHVLKEDLRTSLYVKERGLRE